MSKKYVSPKQKNAPVEANAAFSAFWQNWAPILLAVCFCLFSCLSSLSTIKTMSMMTVVLFVGTAAVFHKKLRDRISLPLILLTLFVVMCGVSAFYGVSGKFALREFLKVLISYCAALLLLTVAPKHPAEGGRWLAGILSGGAALMSLVSIDLISTRIISTPVISFLNLFSADYADLAGVESGVRMISLIDKPNVYASIAGIGVLLGLGLAMSETRPRHRCLQLVCLFVNALGFLLAFSMGGSAMIALAFAAYLLLEAKERRGALLVLMAETLLLTLLALVPISMTSLTAWTEVRPIPLVCTVLGAVLLCLLDRFVGQKAGGKLTDKGRVVSVLIVGFLVLAVGFMALAYNLTGGIALARGEKLRRSVYPEGGSYTVSADFDGAVNVTVESQNRQETMMHTSTVLYKGALEKASFTVPEDSLVVYFNFSAGEDTQLTEVILQGTNGMEQVPLSYRLLPAFISNRLQGLFANQNAIQRVVFFEDGMKLFRRSPIVGLGMGAYENSIRSVQSFDYETKYAHNHYIQVLVETGVVGLVLFVGLLLICAFALWRARKAEAFDWMLPALGAALVFMAGHAAVEVNFSFYAYLPFAFGVFALISLCTADSMPTLWLKGKVRYGIMLGTGLLLGVFAFFLAQNMKAVSMISDGKVTINDLTRAVEIDRFEWADYAVSYLVSIPADADAAHLARANGYAERLSKLDSNGVPRYLMDFYFKTGQTERAFAMAEKYVSYVAADPDTWQTTFDLLMRYYQDSEEFKAGVMRIADMLDAWNAENIGSISLNGAANTFLEKIEG